MIDSKINIIFVIALNRKRKDLKAPLFCRITFLKQRKQFSTGIFINPNYWDSTLQKALDVHIDNKQINTQLSLIKQKINQAFLFLQVQTNNFDVEDIWLRYKGEDVKPSKTLIEVFNLHNSRMEKLVGLEYTKSTFSKFKEAKQHVENFLFYKYKKRNLVLEEISLKFLNDFDYYLKTELNFKQITINKSIQRVRKIIKLALAEGFISRDPFILYKPKKVQNNVIYLTTNELSKLENHRFAQSRLEQVKDMFIFCCYTGLPYQEMSVLNKDHIVKKFDQKLWIEMFRQKTKKQISIPLLPKAILIIEKYQNDKNLLPVISNQKFNSYLKEISEIVGIKKNLTHHIARKTFASTVLLYNDVPMEIVSELLGHSNMSVTQESYAKVIQRKVSDEMLKLKKKLK